MDLSDFHLVPQELKFWKDNVAYLNCKNLFVSSIPFIIPFSDASETSCASLLSIDGVISHRTWLQVERCRSSTWREMTAVHYSLISFLPFLKSKSVYWFSDNQAAVININYGSRKLELQSIALDIFSVCLNNNNSLFPHWIPRDMNETADFVSKLVNYDDWFVSHEFSKR